MEDKIKKLNQIIKESKSVVFFGGAGVSTESGIPDFRSVYGLYNQVYNYPPEMILSHSFFMNNVEEFYHFYYDKMIPKNIKPNDCHKKLVDLEKFGKLKCIITQNIDGLHEQAGSKNIINLHGTIYKNHCMRCNKFYSLNEVIKSYKCSCGGVIKPDVVLYEEGLNNDDLTTAINEISSCDTLIIGGTSLNVYPAAGLVNYFNGKNLVVINKDEINVSNANLIINEKIGEVFKQIEIE